MCAWKLPPITSGLSKAVLAIPFGLALGAVPSISAINTSPSATIKAGDERIDSRVSDPGFGIELVLLMGMNTGSIDAE